jgi:Small-conductance mechanosensitive channel
VENAGLITFGMAGLAAVVAGLAARTMLSNLLAGVQIALSQPVRLEDVVIMTKIKGCPCRFRSI